MTGSKVKRTLKSALSVLCAAAALAILYFFVFSIFFDTDEQAVLQTDNEAIEEELEELSERKGLLDTVVNDLYRRDLMIYRNLFSADPFSLTRVDSSSFILSFDSLEVNPSRNEGMVLAASLIEDRFFKMIRKMDSSGFHGRNVPSIPPLKGFVPSNVSASVGDKMDPFLKTFKYHSGLDIAAAEFTDVMATADGVVSSVKRAYLNDGNLIEIDHGDYKTKYTHLGDILVRKGQRVKRGTTIARIGNTGVSFLPHLHYEIHFKGEVVNPVYYMFQGLTPNEFLEMIMLSENSMQTFD